MPISDGTGNQAQGLTDRYFAQHASDWDQIYRLHGVKEFIHQERLRTVLALISGLALPAGAPALEVGCGAGYAATQLAEQGYSVDAIDPVQEMVDATRTRATRLGLNARVRARIGDVCSLPFQDETFRMVIAMGVLPWLPSIDQPLREMSRVLRPGGYLIVTTDNLWSLRWWLEPLSNPLVRPAKELLKRVLRLLGREASCAPWYPTSRSTLDGLLESKGLEKVAGLTSGFGPFTCLNREFLSPRRGRALHSRLQHMANQGVPVLRSTGCHYIVLARKIDVPAEVKAKSWQTHSQSDITV